jgi:hypothetical protein
LPDVLSETLPVGLFCRSHELVELFLVLAWRRRSREVLEFDLLLFEALQRFDAVFVEGAGGSKTSTRSRIR